MLNPIAAFPLEMNVKWLDSIRRFVLDADARAVDLNDLDLTVEEIKSILRFLAESQVYALDLSNHDLKNEMDALCELLIKTKIKKLDLRSCQLTLEDIISLMGILKDLQITHLDISRNKCVFRQPECNEFIAFMRESHLTALNLSGSAEFMTCQDVFRFVDTLCKTSITNLNLDGVNYRNRFSDAILSLFHSLKHTAITHLSLVSNNVFSPTSDIPQKFGDSLRESKLIELDLSRNGPCIIMVEHLFQALEGSQVSNLKLEGCYVDFKSICPFLKYTQITRLDLSRTGAKVEGELPDASLVSLRLRACTFKDDETENFMRSLKSSKLEEFDIGDNQFEDSALIEFSNCVSETAITSVNFSGHSSPNFLPEPRTVSNFLGALKNSNVSCLKIRSLNLDHRGAEIAFPNLKNTKLTQLDLGSNNLSGGLQSLAEVLKFTALTYLNLKSNNINDEDSKVLAECLKETRIYFLHLGSNKITDSGAVALARSLKSSDILTLNLKNNKIKNPGLEALASNAEGTFITVLQVRKNPGNGRIVDPVVWDNRRTVLECLRFFKQIAPEPGTTSLRFGDIVSTADVDKFLDECLNFYKILLSNQSTAVTAFSQLEKFTVGQDRINALLFEEFPRQFVQFIVTHIEAEVSEHVSFLMKVEEMGLTQIVEFLLLNRPNYTIDESQGILHPYVYKLLNQNKLPICNLDVEPRGIERIVEYFTENKDINGVDEVIDMLKRL